MRYSLLLLLWCPSLAAVAQADRYVVEDGTAATVSSASSPTLVRGQTLATLVAHTCAANSCTRTAPSASTEGVELGGVGAYLITASLSTGTFSGTGAIELWVYDVDAGGWRYLVGKDQTPASGKSTAAFPVQVNTFRAGKYRVAARSNAVATSAAAPTLTVTIRACLKQGCAL